MSQMSAVAERPDKREVNMVARALRMAGAQNYRDGSTRRLMFGVRRVYR